mmetsp:Transcript_8952/g.16125  ORF Transcript_8952/g.16125 Transcript_8952/m.16125 type:complete len:388 (-) Transcript_8952:2916-4079(-)
MGIDGGGAVEGVAVYQSKPSWGARFLPSKLYSAKDDKVVIRKGTSEEIQSRKMDTTAKRHPNALSVGGGFGSGDDAALQEQRLLAVEVVKQVGMNVLRGKDLLYVTFPIKTAEPRTALQKFALSCAYAPDLLSAAAKSTDPLQRFKYVIAFYVGGMHTTSGIKKPLNPILGETLVASLDENTTLYMEQTSHHPPVSNWQLRGDGYEYWGYMTYQAKLGFNEVRLLHHGERQIDFDDGTSISFNNPYDTFSGVLWGSFVHVTLGSVEFVDKKNGLYCELKFGASRKELSDYCEGIIMKDNEPVAEVSGSWASYLDSDGIRYWSWADQEMYKASPSPTVGVLPSDSSRRADLIEYTAGNLEAAQERKTELENRQRNDRKLRKGEAAVSQ